MCISVELCDSFVYAKEINVYNDGAVEVYTAGEKEFDVILTAWKDMIDSAHEMPAYGVSLNRETVKAMNSGVWVEFVFCKKYESNGMPYEKLLINVNENAYGFNLIRYNSENGYDGRCFYYDLVNKDMGKFYEILLNL